MDINSLYTRSYKMLTINKSFLHCFSHTEVAKRMFSRQSYNKVCLNNMHVYAFIVYILKRIFI